MSKREKLLAKLLDPRMTLSWPERVTLLEQLGYQVFEGAGSRGRFENADPDAQINLHRPHPGNELRAYARRQVIDHLISGGLIP